MITMITSPSGYYFSSDVPDVKWSMTGDHAYVAIYIDDDETHMFGETLFPDRAGTVTMSDMGGLLLPYAKSRMTIAVRIELREEDKEFGTMGERELSFNVVYCAADVGTTASDFWGRHFLTLLDGPKVTAEGRLEYVHYIDPEGEATPRVTAAYGDGSTAEFAPEAVGDNACKTLDVSPGLFKKEGKLLVGYTVSAGDRRQAFEMDLSTPDCAPVLIFVNSFGCDELVYCTGTHKVAPKYERSSAYVDGLKRNYQIEETREFTADTGVLNFAMANWLDDLFRSDSVRVVNFYDGEATVGKEVTITESKSEYTNDEDELPRFSITYQYAQKNHNVMDLRRGGRIFDNTFDYTFE